LLMPYVLLFKFLLLFDPAVCLQAAGNRSFRCTQASGGEYRENTSKGQEYIRKNFGKIISLPGTPTFLDA